MSVTRRDTNGRPERQTLWGLKAFHVAFLSRALYVVPLSFAEDSRTSRCLCSSRKNKFGIMWIYNILRMSQSYQWFLISTRQRFQIHRSGILLRRYLRWYSPTRTWQENRWDHLQRGHLTPYWRIPNQETWIYIGRWWDGISAKLGRGNTIHSDENKNPPLTRRLWRTWERSLLKDCHYQEPVLLAAKRSKRKERSESFLQKNEKPRMPFSEIWNAGSTRWKHNRVGELTD